MPIDDYIKAKKLGIKRSLTDKALGLDPYLPCLDDILEKEETAGEIPLGLMEIPLEMMVGTKTRGRKTAFASNFMPLLKENTEFAIKWSQLSDAHESEGIHDPVSVYEYRNKYYVQEGNKRVSVLRFWNASCFQAYVTRILPKKTDDEETRIYYEFVDFFKATGFNEIWFSEEGSFPKMLALTGSVEGEVWEDQKKEDFKSAYRRFAAVFETKNDKSKLEITAGDAFLNFVEVYTYDQVKEMTDDQMKAAMGKLWNEFAILDKEEKVTLITDPEETISSPSLFSRIFNSPSKDVLKIAFIHGKKATDSSWVYAHELGRAQLESALGGRIQTQVWEECETNERGEAAIEEAIQKGFKMIFVTTPNLVVVCQKKALQYADVRILNCSINTSYHAIRTYYARMYEAKFLMGAMAAALSEDSDLGYVADYPIHGTMAGINAFALGAQMINPHAQVFLEWTSMKGDTVEERLAREKISMISGRDMIIPNQASRKYGLYSIKDKEVQNIATSIWNWGKFYELIVRSVLDGGWKKESYKSTKALNYWWGLSSGVIEVICSKKVPAATRRLINFLQKSICNGQLKVFEGKLISQYGPLEMSGETLTQEEIVRMNWLAENVVGFIPDISELNPQAQQLVEIQGVRSQEMEML